MYTPDITLLKVTCMTDEDYDKIIEELEAKLSESEALLAKAVEALTVIDALDPEGLINGCSQSALIGLVLRMGEIARTTLAELTSSEAANGEHRSRCDLEAKGGKDE